MPMSPVGPFPKKRKQTTDVRIEYDADIKEATDCCCALSLTRSYRLTLSCGTEASTASLRMQMTLTRSLNPSS